MERNTLYHVTWSTGTAQRGLQCIVVSDFNHGACCFCLRFKDGFVCLRRCLSFFLAKFISLITNVDFIFMQSYIVYTLQRVLHTTKKPLKTSQTFSDFSKPVKVFPRKVVCQISFFKSDVNFSWKITGECQLSYTLPQDKLVIQFLLSSYTKGIRLPLQKCDTHSGKLIFACPMFILEIRKCIALTITIFRRSVSLLHVSAALFFASYSFFFSQ